MSHQQQSGQPFSEHFKYYYNVFKDAIQNNQKPIKTIVEDLCITPGKQFYWIILEEILKYYDQKNDQQTINTYINELIYFMINRNKEIKNLSIIIYLYNLLKSPEFQSSQNSQDSISSLNWQSLINRILQRQSDFQFHRWISTTQYCRSLQVKQTIYFFAQNLPIIINQYNIPITLHMAKLLTYLLSFMDLTRSIHYIYLQNLTLLLQAFIQNIINLNLKEATPNDQRSFCVDTVISIMIQNLAKNKLSKGNFFMFFELNIIQNHIVSLTPNENVHFFKKFFSKCITIKGLKFLLIWTILLQQYSEKQQLIQLYKQFILPCLIYKSKTLFQQQVFNIGSFYVMQFLHIYNIGLNGFKALLQNITKLSNKQYKQRWIQLTLLVAQNQQNKTHQPSYLQYVQNQLLIKDISKDLIDRLKSQKIQRFINQSAGAPRKKLYSNYTYPYTRYKGISNSSQQCYIIVILQAFYTTQQLEPFINRCQRIHQSQFLQSIKQLFKRLKLQNKQNNPIKVDDVKEHGPQHFQNINSQQDAHQYLLSFINKISSQLQRYGNTQMKKQFQKTIKNKQIRTIQCRYCNIIRKKQQQVTVCTIPNQSSLNQFVFQGLSDYRCDTCSSSSINTLVQFTPTSSIFFVHLNRFSFSNNICHKQLKRSKIQRYFLNYQLIGIITHIGKTISSGHYIYYYKINQKEWVEFNDSQVKGIYLDQDNQQFQHQLPIDYSPYILIYKKCI